MRTQESTATNSGIMVWVYYIEVYLVFTRLILPDKVLIQQIMDCFTPYGLLLLTLMLLNTFACVTVYGKTQHMGSTRFLRNACFQYLRSKMSKSSFIIFMSMNPSTNLPPLTEGKRKLPKRNKPSF